jgi:hypothetical protein
MMRLTASAVGAISSAKPPPEPKNHASEYALASKPTKTNPISPEQQAKYGERAVALLRQIVAKRYTNVHEMTNVDDLKPLRPRDDFQKLLREMQK